MSKVIKLKKGLDIELVGVAEKTLSKAPAAATYAVVPEHYKGVTPKLLVNAADAVKAGTPLFFDKENPEVLFTSPVSGTVREIVRGAKRKILSIVIEPDGKMESEVFEKPATAEQGRELLLASGLWPTIMQRPFGVIAKSTDLPRDIFITGFDSAPLGADLNFLVQGQKENITAGVELLSKLTTGKVHLTLGTGKKTGCVTRMYNCGMDRFNKLVGTPCAVQEFKPVQDVLGGIANAEMHTVSGKHPAGNVGVQIANIAPVAKGDIVWTVDIQHVAIMGKLALTGRLDMSKTIALAGSEVKRPKYYRIISGASIDSIVKGNIKGYSDTRTISGNPLTGSKVTGSDYIGFYDNSVSILPEGNHYEFVGWALPRLGKFSVSHTYFSWLTPWKKYRLDTNLNGGPRAFVMNGIYEKVVPIPYFYPVYLLKAVMAGDIDKMEKLGIYEVIEEDLALCEFICPSKIEWQSILRGGIELMIKEM